MLLRRALEETERTAVVLMTLRKRTRLGLLRVRDDVLVLQTMLWPDEVRVPEFEGIADEDITVRPQELAMAGSLVESLSADFDPTAYTDEYRQAVLALVTQKLAGEDVILPSSPGPPTTPARSSTSWPPCRSRCAAPRPPARRAARPSRRRTPAKPDPHRHPPHPPAPGLPASQDRSGIATMRGRRSG